MKPVVLLLVALFAATSLAQKPLGKLNLPEGYTIPKITRSPNGHYGVLVPDAEHAGTAEHNKIIDLRTGKAVGDILGQELPFHANHTQVEATNWSRDGSLLLWRVQSKWTYFALVLIKVKNGRIVWQRDATAPLVRAIYARTKRANPRQYRIARNAADRYGGMATRVSVSLEPGQPLTFPLEVEATLTANLKDYDGFPKNANLDSELHADMTKEGKVVVKKFALATVR
jgi:hypothetical protein